MVSANENRTHARAEQQLRRMIRDLMTEGQESGDVRGDVSPDELVNYCLHALTAASGLPSKPAIRRLVTVTLAGLQPPPIPVIAFCACKAPPWNLVTAAPV
ncbi:MAG: hypothetical protein ACRDKZ_12560 [Actinomycetota bacterium]